MLSAPGAQTSRGNRNVSTAIDRPSDLPGATGRGALNPGKAPLTLRAGLRPQRWHLADAPGDSLGPRKRLEGQPKIHAGLLWRGLSLSAISHSSIAAGGVGCTFFSASLADFRRTGYLQKDMLQPRCGCRRTSRAQGASVVLWTWSTCCDPAGMSLAAHLTLSGGIGGCIAEDAADAAAGIRNDKRHKLTQAESLKHGPRPRVSHRLAR